MTTSDPNANVAALRSERDAVAAQIARLTKHGQPVPDALMDDYMAIQQQITAHVEENER